MIAPISLDGVSLYHATMPKLAELSVRISLQLDYVAATAVLEAERLDVDRAGPVVPASVFFAVNIDVWCTILVGELVLGQLVVLDPISFLL